MNADTFETLLWIVLLVMLGVDAILFTYSWISGKADREARRERRALAGYLRRGEH